MKLLPAPTSGRIASLAIMLALFATSTSARASQKTRDAKAQALLDSGKDKATKDRLPEAKSDLGGCVAQKPSKPLLANCYRNLGIVQVRLGDNKGAVASFKKYLPSCAPEECDKVKDMIARLSQ